MLKPIPVNAAGGDTADFADYEARFKALADRKRLRILFELTRKGCVCVCDLTDIVDMPQSKLSYHLKILLDAGLITREIKGTWSYYALNHAEMNRLLSPELCCVFRQADAQAANDGCC
ncbi:ArsR/SmtB family transcription factor [Paenibacillus sp. GCM10023250]|uniref:ArsR/SmtB family transcription factor n=1 Tax=Paenibacillus sp. GCM10023250 TaxID=3252648 RepID=UPI003609DEE3